MKQASSPRLRIETEYKDFPLIPLPVGGIEACIRNITFLAQMQGLNARPKFEHWDGDFGGVTSGGMMMDVYLFEGEWTWAMLLDTLLEIEAELEQEGEYIGAHCNIINEDTNRVWVMVEFRLPGAADWSSSRTSISKRAVRNRLHPPVELSLPMTGNHSSHWTFTNNGTHPDFKIEVEFRGSHCGHLDPNGIEISIANATAEAHKHGLNTTLPEYPDHDYYYIDGPVWLDTMTFEPGFTWRMLLTALAYTFEDLKKDGLCACDFIAFTEEDSYWAMGSLNPPGGWGASAMRTLDLHPIE
ncbi:hypothetical protein ACLMJK_008715 [Lecanora helva]